MPRLDANDVDHICRVDLAFSWDSMVAGINARHVVGLSHQASMLRGATPRASIDAAISLATCGSRGRFPITPTAGCLMELRHINVALQASVLILDSVPGLGDVVAAVFESAGVCAREFDADFADDVRARHEYLIRFLGE